MSTDTTAGILDAIDGALRDLSADAMRWVPEGKREDVPAETAAAEDFRALGRALAEAFRPLAEYADAVIRGMSEWTAGPQFRALAEIAASPRVQEAVEEAKRRRAAGVPRACHCLCGRSHPAIVNVCDAHQPVTARRYVTEALGEVDVPLCAPCAAAQGVPVPRRGMSASVVVYDELDEYLAGQMRDPGFRAAYEAAGPPAVDGRAYQRRIRARRKRRR